MAMPSEQVLNAIGGLPFSRSAKRSPSTKGMNEGSGEVDGCPVNLRQFSPLSRSTTMMPPGPVEESVRYAQPAFPCRRSNRTSLTYVVGVTVVEEKTIVFATLFVAKSIANIFA